MSTETRSFSELPPLGLYVHIPWCIRKCPYCDFNSHEQREELPQSAYINALLDDLASEMPSVWGRTISSVFIGGGTPSLFSAQSLDQLLSGIRSLTGLTPGVEITLEANPGTFEQERFKDYHALGINRLSIGVQSFNQKHLESLGRAHSSQDAFKAVEIAHRAGFEQINLDIMFALPGQNLSECTTDIEQALSLSTSHLSCYELTLEPNTLFARFPPALPDEDTRAKMQDTIVQRLAAAGFERYEVSAYSRSSAPSDNRCRHNLNYWLFGDYIGIGAGAHGKVSSAQSGEISRRWKQKHPRAYLDADDAAQRLGGQSVVPVTETGFEFMMNALRIKKGFPIPLFEQHTGVSLNHWQPTIERAMRDGLLEQSGLNLHASDKGYDWLNTILQLFLPDDAGDASGSVKKNYPTIALNLEKR